MTETNKENSISSYKQQYRKATTVFLVSCKRLYTTIKSEDNSPLNDFDYVFVPVQNLPILINPEMIASFSSLFDLYPENVYSSVRKYAEKNYAYDNVTGGITAGYECLWVAENNMQSLEAQETANGLSLRLHYEDWVQEVSYRGDYSIEWDCNSEQ